MPQLPSDGQGEEDGAEDAAEEADAALPHLEDAERVVGVVAEVVDDVGEAGADEAADRRPDQDRVDVVLADALALGLGQHEAGAEQEPDGDADPVGRDVQRAELEVDDRVVGERGEHGCTV